MDKTQLITIVVSTVTGAIIKELILWIASVIKSTKIVSAITAKLKITFSKTNRAVIFDIMFLSFYVAVLVNFALDKSPPTRLSILVAMGAVLACVFMAAVLIFDVSKAIIANENRPPEGC